MARPIRLKTHWFKVEQARSPTDLASAMAAVVWRTASQRVGNLRDARFEVSVGAPYVAMQAEILALLVTIADRLAYAHEPDTFRHAFTSALTIRIAELMADNYDDLLVDPGQDSLGKRFIGLANQRFVDYAEFEFDGREASFQMLRLFGEFLEDACAVDDDRRWIRDQAMTVEGPSGVEVVAKAMRGVLGQEAAPKRSVSAGE